MLYPSLISLTYEYEHEKQSSIIFIIVDKFCDSVDVLVEKIKSLEH